MLISKLIAQLGSQQALLELKWMKLALSSSNLSLTYMLKRRILGEPLQYILGMILPIHSSSYNLSYIRTQVLNLLVHSTFSLALRC